MQLKEQQEQKETERTQNKPETKLERQIRH